MDRLDEDDVVSNVSSRLLRTVSLSMLANTFIPLQSNRKKKYPYFDRMGAKCFGYINIY